MNTAFENEYGVCVCVCVCVKERESLRGGGWEIDDKFIIEIYYSKKLKTLISIVFEQDVFG